MHARVCVFMVTSRMWFSLMQDRLLTYEGCRTFPPFIPKVFFFLRYKSIFHPPNFSDFKLLVPSHRYLLFGLLLGQNENKQVG